MYDEKLMNKFIEILKSKYRQKLVKSYLAVFNDLTEFCRNKGKGIIELCHNDFEELKENWLYLKIYHSVLIASSSLILRYIHLRDFYKWLYDEGYIKSFLLEKWISSKLKKYIEENRKTTRICKNRYYSNEEILRAYKNFVTKKSFINKLFNRVLTDIKHFIRYLINNKKTLYTATKETISEFKHYLLIYEHRPGCYYSSHTQMQIMHNVKRFYDWFTAMGYRQDNPAINYKPVLHKRWVENHQKNRKTKEKNIEWYDPLFNEFMNYEKDFKRLKPITLHSHKKGCLFFFEYLNKIGINDIKEVDRPLIKDFQSYLSRYNNNEGMNIPLNTQIRHIAGIVNFFKYLEKYGIIEKLISVSLEYPKQENGLSTFGMKDIEAKKMIELAKGSDKASIRDRTILELLYSSGIRLNEARILKLKYIDLESGMIRIDIPKGGKRYERIVPIGKSTCEWIKRYKKEVRQYYPQSEYLFINERGQLIGCNTIGYIVRKYKILANLQKKKIVTHSFRVTCATEMLKRGANIKIVQEQLGHTSIQSTEKYLRLVPTDLKKAHTKYHPRS